MPHYLIVLAIALAAVPIAAFAVLKGLSARLDARLRTLDLARARLGGSTSLAASSLSAADWQFDEPPNQGLSFDEEPEWNPLNAPYRPIADETLINPATGLPMVGGVDLAGNFYGFDNSTIGFDAASLFDGGSAFESHVSSFDTSSSFDSPSSFD